MAFKLWLNGSQRQRRKAGRVWLPWTPYLVIRCMPTTNNHQNSPVGRLRLYLEIKNLSKGMIHTIFIRPASSDGTLLVPTEQCDILKNFQHGDSMPKQAVRFLIAGVSNVSDVISIFAPSKLFKLLIVEDENFMSLKAVLCISQLRWTHIRVLMLHSCRSTKNNKICPNSNFLRYILTEISHLERIDS